MFDLAYANHTVMDVAACKQPFQLATRAALLSSVGFGLSQGTLSSTDGHGLTL
jgi:hypothetical protein